MSSRVRNISFDCADTYDLSGFWSKVLGYPRHPDDHPGDPEAILLPPDEVSPVVFFQTVPEGKPGEPRTVIHLDLMPTQGTRDEEVERLVGIGATMVADDRKPDGTGWVTMAEPEGNQFRVERSATERIRRREPHDRSLSCATRAESHA